MKTDHLARLRAGEKLSMRDQIHLIVTLSMPAIMAQISSIIMQYIDTSMVGRLGAAESASIGLIASSTWLMNGLLTAAVTGFTVQVAQKIGAGREREARDIMKHGFVFAIGISLLLAAVGAGISGVLPGFLGGGDDIRADSSVYFLIFSLSLPAVQLCSLSGGMLQASGNMRTPGALNVMMCALDVVFNYIFIFPTREVFGITVPGADLGVAGASLGTAMSQVVTAAIMAYCLLKKSPVMRLKRGERCHYNSGYIRLGVRIGVPVAIEQSVMCAAYIAATKIVSPLGNVAIAANSFAVTAESLCYMPGYGIGAAASTLIGQSIGAGRDDLTRRLGWICTVFGMAVMTVSGALMFFAAPYMIGFLSPDAEVVALGTRILRLEAFAEPMYAASIVASGVFRGAGDTLASGVMNFVSMWAVRIPLSWFLAPRYGLMGVWVAMCIELCFRGTIFLARLYLKSKKPKEASL